MKNPITVEVLVHAPVEKVWSAFISPEAIMEWNSASVDWHTPRAENDLKVGGRFVFRMEAKDGSEGFDFSGVYDVVIPFERIAYTIEDGRKVELTFIPENDSVKVVESFEPETENSLELQRAGWQAILDNFKKYTENSLV